MLKSYGFADGNGDSIARGVQLTPRQALARAQSEANTRCMAVSFWEEGDHSGETGEGKEAETLVTVEPD